MSVYRLNDTSVKTSHGHYFIHVYLHIFVDAGWNKTRDAYIDGRQTGVHVPRNVYSVPWPLFLMLALHDWIFFCDRNDVRSSRPAR